MTTAHAVGPVRATGLVLEGLWTWYRRNWRATIVSTFLTPVMFLVAMGYGLGSRITPGPATEGQPYLVYLAPAVLVASALQITVGEATYPILAAFKWDERYWGIISTPITVDQLLAGQLSWIAVRAISSGVAYLVVATLFGAFVNAGALIALPVSLLTGMSCAVWVVAWSATVNDEGSSFTLIFRFLLLPMTLFAGTYYPVSRLPVWSRPIAWLTPLWHGNELARGAELGGVGALAAVGHVAYLVAVLVGGLLVARMRFRRRLWV